MSKEPLTHETAREAPSVEYCSAAGSTHASYGWAPKVPWYATPAGTKAYMDAFHDQLARELTED